MKKKKKTTNFSEILFKLFVLLELTTISSSKKGDSFYMTKNLFGPIKSSQGSMQEEFC